MNWGLEASNMFHWKIVCVTGFQILVQNCKDLTVQNLEFSNAIHHSFQGLKMEKTQTVETLQFVGSFGLVRKSNLIEKT